MRFRLLKVPLTGLAATAMAAAAVSGVAASAPSASKPSGKTIFQEKCVMCHGMDGKGFAAIHTPDFTDPKWQAAHPEKERLEALENGVKGTAMLSFKGKLSDAQMHAVLDYIQSLGGHSKQKEKK